MNVYIVDWGLGSDCVYHGPDDTCLSESWDSSSVFKRHKRRRWTPEPPRDRTDVTIVLTETEIGVKGKEG